MRRLRRSHRAKPKRHILKNKTLWSFVLLAISVAAFSYDFLFAPFFQIKEIVVSGNKDIAAFDIQKRVADGAKTNLFLISTRSIFLFQSDKTTNALLVDFPQLSSASFKRLWPDRIAVNVFEREAEGLWCESEKCFLLDKDGVIFQEWASQDANILTLRNTADDVATRLGGAVLSAEKLSQILTLQDEFKAFNQEIKEVFFMPEDRINIKTSENWEVYFTLPIDISWQMTRLKLVLEKEIPAEKRPELEYIDLRFSKVYYK